MSIQQNFPAISPSLNLNFARSKTLDPRITFSRTTTATRVNEQGLVEVVSADIPRFDHEYDASTGVIKSLGLLVEEQRSNRVTNNEDLSLWKQNSNPTLNSNDTVSPDGNTTADKVTQTNQVFTGVSTDMSGITTNTVYSCSVFIKPDGDTTTRFGFYDTSNWQGSLDTDWSSGEPSTNGSLGGASDIVYEEYPNGWYRASFKASTQSNAFAGTVSFHCHPDRTGTGKSAWFWGAQLEAGAFPTSYIPTSGSTETRNPDKVSMEGDNFSDWYNQSEGTVFASFRAQAQPSATKYLMGISNNSSGELIYIRATASGSDSAMRDGGSDVAYKPIAYSRDINTLSKHCVSYKQNDFIVSAQGQISTVDDNCTVPTPTNISIGSLYNTTHLGGTISQLTYYPRRLTNTQLQNLTK
jgi:hypothetical protein